MSKGRERDALTEAEWKVMNAVWADEEVTARRVHERLGPETGWAYTTVKTMLDRLVAKGTLRAEKAGLASVYRPAVPRNRARTQALRDLADRAFEGAFGSLAHHLVGRLSPADRRELLELLRREEEE